MCDSKVWGQKKSKCTVRSKLSCSIVFSLQSIFYWYGYFINTITTDIDMLCKVSCNSHLLMDLLQLLTQCCFAHYRIIEYLVGKAWQGKKQGPTVLGLAQSITHIHILKTIARSSAWCWSITTQNIFSDFMIFIDTGHFSCAFGLIFVYGLLPLASMSLSLSHLIFVSFQQNKDFNLSVRSVICIQHFSYKCRNLIGQNKVTILSF